MGWIIRNECDVNSIEPQAGLIDHVWPEDMGLAKSKHLTTPLARVPETRDSGARSGFVTQIMLIGIEAVQLVRAVEIVIHIYSGLVDVHGSGRRSEKSGAPVESSVGCWNQGQQCFCDGIAGTLNLRSLRVRKYVGRGVQSLDMTQPLIAGEEICLAFFDGAAEIAAELIALQG